MTTVRPHKLEDGLYLAIGANDSDGVPFLVHRVTAWARGGKPNWTIFDSDDREIGSFTTLAAAIDYLQLHVDSTAS